MMVHFTRLEIEKAWRWNEEGSLVLDLWYLRSFSDIGSEVYTMQWTVWAGSQEREPGLEHTVFP